MRLTLLAATLALTAAPAMAEDLLFDLANTSTANLQELYVSDEGADNWGDDILGMDLLNAGESATVTIADGMETCTYDMRFVMDNGNTIEGTADLCETKSFTITD